MNKKNIENIYPMTPMQQGILFHTLNAPQTGVYVIQNGYQFNSKINISAFKKAWQQVINQHPILRTSFHWQQDREPFQVVHRQIELPWQELRLGDEETRRRGDEETGGLGDWLEKDRKDGFNLSQAPLMRLSLIHLANNTYQFIWSCHHLILDGWSTALVLKQVLDSYQALCRDRNAWKESNRVVTLSPSRPYVDYVAWLRQQNLSEAKAYWQKTLQGFSSPTRIFPSSQRKTQRPMGAAHASRTQEALLTISTTTTEALQVFAKQHKLTLNTIFQGAWALLLSRYSGENDVVFGATSSGRPPDLVGSELMVGLFINTLPVRVKITSDESLIAWLQKLQSQQIEAQQYEYTPLIQIQQWSDVPKDFSLFESILVFENYPVDTSIADLGMEMEIKSLQSTESTNYPLTISAGLGKSLSLEILYDRDRFTSSTIERLLGHLQHLLEEFVTKPEAILSELSLLTETEKFQLLQEFNQTQSKIQNPNSKIPQCIHQLFEERVDKYPDAIAVVCDDRQLTYRELNQRANLLAHYLKDIDVRSQVLVGVYCDRLIDTIVAVWGILKAGGAYLPLDPEYPTERIAWMLQDACPSVILSQQNLIEQLPEHSAKIICFDRDWDNIAQKERSNLNLELNSENTAYIIYTSGSTGKPKGVVCTHAGLVNTYLAWQNANLLPSHDACFLQMASFSFDVFTGDLIKALCSGGKLVICPKQLLLEPAKLYQFMIRERVNCADFVPAVLMNLVDYLEETKQTLEFMHLLIVGSDAWYVRDYQRVKRLCHKETKLINAYGVSEATIDSTYFESTTVNLSPEQLVPIGKPFSNTQIYILDSNLQPSPIGIAGEIYIGGNSLARGYLNNPELTNEKFISKRMSEK